ncbi:MAG: NAD-dependent protein deacetylase [Pseudomonadota bacterium]
MNFNNLDTNDTDQSAARLAALLAGYPRVAVLTGAGCSTASGIPDYRDERGEWKHAQPMQFREFIESHANRQRYWARSFLGWRRVAAARPNATHRALSELESRGRVHQLITQNVDELHERAGSKDVVHLHGVLSQVTCLSCGDITQRSDLQVRLEELNVGWSGVASSSAPDGDAAPAADTRDFSIVDCERCGGVLKPNVVFFGEGVPKHRVEGCKRAVTESDALIVVGSSLMVFSGFRFARLARSLGKPIVIVNRGKTRADDIADARFNADCGELLTGAVERLVA